MGDTIVGVVELDFGEINGCLIGLDGRTELVHQRLLGIVHLLRDDVGSELLGVPFQIQTCIGQLRLVLGLLRLDLLDLCPVILRINLCK